LDEKINLLEFSTKNKTKNLGLLYLRLVILIISTLVEIIFSGDTFDSDNFTGLTVYDQFFNFFDLK